MVILLRSSRHFNKNIHYQQVLNTYYYYFLLLSKIDCFIYFIFVFSFVFRNFFKNVEDSKTKLFYLDEHRLDQNHKLCNTVLNKRLESAMVFIFCDFVSRYVKKKHNIAFKREINVDIA